MKHVRIFQGNEKKKEVSDSMWLGEEGTCEGLHCVDGILQRELLNYTETPLALGTQLFRKEFQGTVLSSLLQRNLCPSSNPERYTNTERNQTFGRRLSRKCKAVSLTIQKS